MARDWRDERIEALEAQLVEERARSEQTIAALTAQVDALLKRVATLEERLSKSSRNSSKPPSSDGPAVPPRPKKPPSGRKPGGQPGHDRNERELVAVEKVRKSVDCIPDRCGHCAAGLRGRDPDPHRHQVAHLPKVEPITDEYRQHSLTCEECGKKTLGQLPAGVPRGMFGPSVIAVVAAVMGPYRLSKRLTVSLLWDLYSLRMSVGAAVGCQQLASEALAAPHEEVKASIATAPVKHADETGWREGPERMKAWLWVAVTSTLALFMVHRRRNADAAKALLGEVCGVLVTDRHGAYNFWPDVLRQFCWSHLIRDFKAIEERGGESERVGNALLEETTRMFHYWHRVRDGTLKRSSFQVYMRTVRGRIEALLAEGAGVSHPKTSKTCKKILAHVDCLWTFVFVEGVEPTNNRGEQIIRHAVILRKLSHGTHSERGSRFIERILTAHATLRLQKRNVLEFLRQACEAHIRGKMAPSLLPQDATEPFARAA